MSIETDMEAIGLQWEKFINNQMVDKNLISPMILGSWQRSAKANVNPYTID